jgi:hypothetical protein
MPLFGAAELAIRGGEFAMFRKLPFTLLIGLAWRTPLAPGQEPVYRLLYSPRGPALMISEGEAGCFNVQSARADGSTGEWILMVTSNSSLSAVYSLAPNTAVKHAGRASDLTTVSCTRASLTAVQLIDFGMFQKTPP